VTWTTPKFLAARDVLLAAAACVALQARPALGLFEDLPASPRARALGQAMTAVTDDAWAFYYNPGMLPRLSWPMASMATVRPNGLDFNRLTTVAVAAQLPGRAGGVAFGWRRYGTEYRDVQLNTENTLSVSHGFMLFSDASTTASLGWTLNVYNAEFGRSVGAAGDGSDGIDPGSAWAVGLDVGGVVTVYDRTRVGFHTRNLNNPTIGDDAEELVRGVEVGIAYEPYPGVTSALDLAGALGQDFRFRGGMEFEVIEALDLRFGLETEPNRLTAGFGVHVPVLELDYGFSTGGGVLDASHHFGVSVRWDRGDRTAP
jgi:hypothetical protein